MDKRFIPNECLSGTGYSYTLSPIDILSMRAVFSETNEQCRQAVFLDIMRKMYYC